MQKLFINLSDMLEFLPLAWSVETRSVGGIDDYVNESNIHPARGQCVVSSLLIQKHFGGNLIRCIVDVDGRQIPHYFNELDSGMWIDSTRAQFDKDCIYSDIVRNPSPDLYIFKDTWQSVRKLEGRVLDIINSTYVYGWK